MNHPDLFALLRGELTNREAAEAGEHLEQCAECRDDLAELAVGNAVLTRAARTERTGGTAAIPPAAVPPMQLPRRRPRPVLLVAAAAVLVGGIAGAVTTAAVTGAPGSGKPAEPSAYATAELDPVEGSGIGEVQMVAEDSKHTRMTISTQDLPPAGRHRFYYAWLLDPQTNKMLPLGQVGPTGTASFELDDSLLDAYAAVDVSLEDDDGDPGHSVTSVLRGTYQERTSRS